MTVVESCGGFLGSPFRVRGVVCGVIMNACLFAGTHGVREKGGKCIREKECIYG